MTWSIRLQIFEDAKREAQINSSDVAFVDAKLADGNKGYRLAMHLAAKHGTNIILLRHDPNQHEQTTFDGMFHCIKKAFLRGRNHG